MTYPLHRSDAVTPSPNLPQMELDTLAYWKADDTFAASIEKNPAGENGSNEFVFYDGPPFANGLPHYGHLLTGYVKDVVPRFETMRGKHVDRRFGWDTHGLPAEVEAEKQLGITVKADIETMGIAKFNDVCRSSVLRYTDQWQDYVTRQARWVDFDNDYKTLDLDYMESVMWAFKTLWDKDLIYQGHRVLWYCTRCETPLSNAETGLDDVYRPKQDTAVTVAFRLENGVEALAWTTTPWTLPSNLALAVHPDVDYVVVVPETMPENKVLLAEARLGAYARELGENPTVLQRMKGQELLGLRYTPLFDFFADRENAFQILAADYVTTDDGTGVVHIAPAFGEADKEVTDAVGIELVNPLDSSGRFTSVVPPYAGMWVFDANKPIIKDLKAQSKLLRQESYEHSYPHCWRCDTPLIQNSVSSWFVAVTKIRDRMVELNQTITWVPEHIRDGQMGKWLEGAIDWSISRNRYWGSPIPVWMSDDPAYPRVDVYGSLDQMEADFGVRPADLHRPFVDDLTRPNPDDPTGRSTMRRVPEVLDCWFESGSMPYAQVHYPFENTEWFEHHYPGDFIVEYNGQTRGWFYTLHVLATALFDRAAFKSVVAHGIVLGNDGRKMSKSLRNYPDVSEVFDRDGSDAMRWFLMSSPILRGGNLVVAEEGIRDSVRQVLLPIWNTWYFYALYANACNGGKGIAGRKVSEADAHVLTDMDRYLLASTRNMVERVTEQLDRFAIADACESVRSFLDLLTNWYVRRSRDRFWDEDAVAFNTLYTALEVLMRVLAPLAPLMSEEIWRGLTGGRSVHLEPWPDPAGADAEALPANPGLVVAMDRVRQVCSAALGVRKTNSVRVRQPLGDLVVADSDAEKLLPFIDLIGDELNVKRVRLVSLNDAVEEFGVTRRLSVNARAAGPRLGKKVQAVIKAAKAGEWSQDDSGVVVNTADGAERLEVHEYESVLEVASAQEGSLKAAALPGNGFVVLDLEITPELAAEGYARDIVRAVQDERKRAELHVTDRIALALRVPSERLEEVEAHREMICTETLALKLTIEPSTDSEPHIEVTRA